MNYLKKKYFLSLQYTVLLEHSLARNKSNVPRVPKASIRTAIVKDPACAVHSGLTQKKKVQRVSMTVCLSAVTVPTHLPVWSHVWNVRETLTAASHQLVVSKTVRPVQLEHSLTNRLPRARTSVKPSAHLECTLTLDWLLALSVPKTSSNRNTEQPLASSAYQILTPTNQVLLAVKSASLYNVPRISVNTVDCVYPLVTESNVSVQLDSLADVARSTSTNVLHNRATTVPLASIYHKTTGVSALPDTLVSTVRKKSPIVEMTRVPKEPCARMSQDSTTTLVCADPVTLVLIVTLL